MTTGEPESFQLTIERKPRFLGGMAKVRVYRNNNLVGKLLNTTEKDGHRLTFSGLVGDQIQIVCGRVGERLYFCVAKRGTFKFRIKFATFPAKLTFCSKGNQDLATGAFVHLQYKPWGPKINTMLAVTSLMSTNYTAGY